MTKRKYFIVYNAMDTNGNWGYGNISLNTNGGKLHDLDVCRQKIKENHPEIVPKTITFIFIKDVTNGF